MAKFLVKFAKSEVSVGVVGLVLHTPQNNK